MWRVNEIYFCFGMIEKVINSLKDIFLYYSDEWRVKFYMNEEVTNIVSVLKKCFFLSAGTVVMEIM